MKYRCSDCGKIVYSGEKMEDCPGCSGVLEDRTPEAKLINCPVSQGTVRQVNGIPDCENFELTNSFGSRCTHGELPARCKSCELPFYSPRVGVSSD